MKGLAVAVALLGLAHLGACQGRSENPCKRRGGTSPHESYCDKFYECVGNDEVVVRDCPNGLVYAGRQALVDVCGYEHEYPCDAGLSRSGAQRRGEGPAEQLDPCKEESGIAAHKDYCDRYLECSAGQVYEVDCPNGLVFAERGAALLDNCGYPNQNPYACLNKQLANPPISTEHCDWLYGIFGHETSCTRYWTCWNGTSTEQFCIGGLLYNEKTHSCDWPEFVA
ncbi:Protein obstructor-E [Amphibalanus amphitrite]|uniref:Protein obstructor-E n=1 Tax=Amphibalanus amphitrite TaxID=1232801 RepID=A0A6A4WD34_AMPAM|nr:Protein obstructor-E [Amphibalanus amphitrite]